MIDLLSDEALDLIRSMVLVEKASILRILSLENSGSWRQMLGLSSASSFLAESAFSHVPLIWGRKGVLCSSFAVFLMAHFITQRVHLFRNISS